MWTRRTTVTPRRGGQSAGSTHCRYLPQRWKEEGVVTISIYQRRRPSTGDGRGGVWGIFVLKGSFGTWGVLFLSSEWIDLSGPGSRSSIKLVLLSWSMKVGAERGFVSCAPSNLPPLQFPSPYELKRVHKNIPLLVLILHPVFIHSSWWTLILFIHSPLCSPPPQRGNSSAD